MRGWLLAVGALAACSSASLPPSASPAGEGPIARVSSMDGGDEADASMLVADDARGVRSSPETAWLVAHLADDPIPTRPNESDAGRRLVSLGAEGVLAVVEVMRVGDRRRAPFARRVMERVVVRRCGGNVGRAAGLVASLTQGGDAGAVAADAAVSWGALGDRWPGETVERVRRWALDGAVCEGL